MLHSINASCRMLNRAMGGARHVAWLSTSSTSGTSRDPTNTPTTGTPETNEQLIDGIEALNLDIVVQALLDGADPYTRTPAPAPPMNVSLYDHVLFSAFERAFTIIDAIAIARGERHGDSIAATASFDRAMLAMGLLKKNRKLFNASFYRDEGKHPVFDDEDNDPNAPQQPPPPSSSSSSSSP